MHMQTTLTLLKNFIKTMKSCISISLETLHQIPVTKVRRVMWVTMKEDITLNISSEYLVQDGECKVQDFICRLHNFQNAM